MLESTLTGVDRTLPGLSLVALDGLFLTYRVSCCSECSSV